MSFANYQHNLKNATVNQKYTVKYKALIKIQNDFSYFNN